MSTSEQRRVGVGVAVIVVRGAAVDEEVLVVQRRFHGDGSWATPGGYIDPGETPEWAAVREVREETGLLVGEPEFRCVTNDIHDDGKHNITLWFVARPVDPEQPLVQSDESLDIRWSAWDCLPQPIYRSFQNYVSGPTYPMLDGNGH